MRQIEEQRARELCDGAVASSGPQTSPCQALVLPTVGESSLLKLATSVVGAIAAIVSIAGAVVGLATTQNLVIALGIAGIIYTAILAGIYFRASLRQSEAWRSFLSGGVAGVCFLIILEAIFGKFVPTWTKTYAHFESFGVLQLLGITGLLLLAFIGAEWARGAYKESKEIKICPDCVEKCKEKAHVCHWCGFRWTACPEKTFMPSDEKVTPSHQSSSPFIPS